MILGCDRCGSLAVSRHDRRGADGEERGELRVRARREERSVRTTYHGAVGLDERLQRETHAERWAEKRFFRIVRDRESIGVVSIDEAPDHVTIGEFYIFSSYHRKGIGTEVLTGILREADAKGLPVRLRCLKWNPAVT